jgi:hypothetical protein
VVRESDISYFWLYYVGREDNRSVATRVFSLKDKKPMSLENHIGCSNNLLLHRITCLNQ